MSFSINNKSNITASKSSKIKKINNNDILDTSKNNIINNNQTLQTLSLLPFDKDLLDLDLNKIRTFISVLEEHENICDKNEKYPEAAKCRDKVKVLKRIEEEKILRDLREMQSAEVS